MTIPIMTKFTQPSNYRIGQKQPDRRPQRPEFTPTIKKMISDRLEEGGFDGLFNADNCACKLDELMACGEPSEYCQAGYIQLAPEDSDYDYFISENKEDEK